MGAKQLELFEPINEKAVQMTVIRELKLFKALKVQIENRKEREAAGMGQLFPSLRSQQQANEMKFRQMKRALDHSLDEEERKIIEMKYLSSTKMKDVTIYLELGLKKDPYYDRKKSALLNLATALGII